MKSPRTHVTLWAAALLIGCSSSPDPSGDDVEGSGASGSGASGSGAATSGGSGGVPTAGGTGGGGAPGKPTTGGAPNAECLPDALEARRLAASSPSECRHQTQQCGVGGALAVACDTVVVELDPPLPRASVVAVETDVPEHIMVATSENLCELDEPCAVLAGEGELNRLQLRWGTADVAEPRYGNAFPTQITVSTFDESDQLLTTQTATLSYSCEVADPWRWCWNAAPVTMDLVTLAEP